MRVCACVCVCGFVALCMFPRDTKVRARMRVPLRILCSRIDHCLCAVCVSSHSLGVLHSRARALVSLLSRQSRYRPRKPPCLILRTLRHRTKAHTPPLLNAHPTMRRPKLIGTFADPTQGILNLDITMYNGNATYIGYYETDVDFSMYSMPQPGGFDYIQVRVRVLGESRVRIEPLGSQKFLCAVHIFSFLALGGVSHFADICVRLCLGKGWASELDAPCTRPLFCP